MMSGPVYMPPTQGGAIAQLGERLNGIQEVVGSIPIGSTRDFAESCVPVSAFGAPLKVIPIIIRNCVTLSA
jgi:hypothetical protein